MTMDATQGKPGSFGAVLLKLGSWVGATALLVAAVLCALNFSYPGEGSYFDNFACFIAERLGLQAPSWCYLGFGGSSDRSDALHNLPVPPPAVEADRESFATMPFGEEPADLARVDPGLRPSLAGIACLPGTQLMVSFEFGQTVSGDFSAIVAEQPMLQTAVPNQPTRLYFLGPTLPRDANVTVALFAASREEPLFSETLFVPACRPVSAQPSLPKCPPPEYFDPVMDRCRILDNHRDPGQVPPNYVPPDD
jgi:hypothetical protein